MKARITALTAKVSLLESEMEAVMFALDVQVVEGNTVRRTEIRKKLGQEAENLGEEE